MVGKSPATKLNLQHLVLGYQVRLYSLGWPPPRHLSPSAFQVLREMRHNAGDNTKQDSAPRSGSEVTRCCGHSEGGRAVLTFQGWGQESCLEEGGFGLHLEKQPRFWTTERPVTAIPVDSTAGAETGTHRKYRSESHSV